MNFLSLEFYLFLLVFLIIYYILPQSYRYIAIFSGSYLFYGFKNPKMLLILLLVTSLTYIGGLIIGKNPKKYLIVSFFLLNVCILFVFKYLNFVIQNYNTIVSKLLSNIYTINEVDIILPIGLSFIIFQSCTYLSDVYHKKIEPEKNLIRYGAFVAFFPTILSGPIQKSRNLLPQIKSPGSFDGNQAQKGTVLFVWGLFEKVMVANNLSIIVSRVFDDYLNYDSAYYILAAISFSLYIYADFSSYSDMARGIAKIMGIDVGKNFNNPYLSVSTSEFWNRWHMSLNSWFIENIYIPLGGNRKGLFRKFLNMFIVFFISGLWHGANWHFIAWGGINGILVISGQLLKPLKNFLYCKLKIDESVESIQFCKQVITFGLITITWVFFRNGIKDSLYIVKRMIFFNPINFFDPNLLSISGTNVTTFITLVATVIFCVIQLKRQNEHETYLKYARQPMLVQCICVAVIICVCIFSICSTETEVNTQFIYFQF